MSTTSLLAEFLVIGLIPFFTVVFGFLLVGQIYDFGFLLIVKDFSTPIAILLILIIYLFGALTHRLGQLINTRTFNFIFKIPFIATIILNQPKPSSPEEWAENMAIIVLFGSDHLQTRIEYNESLLRIFKSMIFTIPVFGVVLSIWLYRFAGIQYTLAILGVCLFLTAASLVTYLVQRNNYRETVYGAAKLIKEHKLNK